MSEWSQEQITLWKSGNWTRAKINALEQIADEHIDNCDECLERLKFFPTDEDYFCPIGESLVETLCQADTEYSWQDDFEA